MSDLKPQTLTHIATVGGRYYGMDRDKRWERIEKGYLAVAEANAPHASDPLSAIRASYDNKITDEFMIPVVMPGYTGMKNGDGLLVGNFRADRVRQILTALLDPNFDGLVRHRTIKFSAATGLTEYSCALNRFMTALYTSAPPTNVLGEILSKHGLTQLHISETEKYAHVTFFLNGGGKQSFPAKREFLFRVPRLRPTILSPRCQLLR